MSNRRKRLIKLVRDRVGRFWTGSDSLLFEKLPRDVFILELRKKLLEEATEYLAEPSAKELADVYEVVRCLAKWDPEVRENMLEIVDLANEKNEERGSFWTGVGMYVYSDAPEAQ